MSSEKKWVLDVDDSVYRAMRKFPRHDVEAIDRVFETMARNPFEGDIVRLKGSSSRWRRRVGSYRIFYIVNPFEHTVTISEVERRTSTTY